MTACIDDELELEGPGWLPGPMRSRMRFRLNDSVSSSEAAGLFGTEHCEAGLSGIELSAGESCWVSIMLGGLRWAPLISRGSTSVRDGGGVSGGRLQEEISILGSDVFLGYSYSLSD